MAQDTRYSSKVTSTERDLVEARMQRGDALHVVERDRVVFYDGRGYCRRGWKGCRQPILWARTVEDRSLLLDPEPDVEGRYRPHLWSCPKAHQFSEEAQRWTW